MEKICSRCKEEKDISCFYNNKSGKNGVGHYCKECDKKWKAHKYINNTEHRQKQLDRRYLNQYNLSIPDVTDMYNSQDGKCSICGKPLLLFKNTVVDHCHKTRVVRGILCKSCNPMLGLCHDNIDILLSAIAYLKKHSVT